jgi:cell division protein FtsB
VEEITDKGKTKRLATVQEYATLKGVTVSKVKSWVKNNRLTTLRRDGQTVIDVTASQEPAEQSQMDVDEPTQLTSSEALLETFLSKAEVSAEHSELSRKKWQFISLVSMMFLAVAVLVVVLLYVELHAVTIEQGRLRVDRYSLSEQAGSAKAEVEPLRHQLEQLQNENNRLAAANAELWAQNESLAARLDLLGQPTDGTTAILPKSQLPPDATEAPQTNRAAEGRTRIEAIREGIYPKDMTRDELVTGLGEPDRVYKTRGYERLVYFNRTPGRFWFENGVFLQANH